MRSGGKRDVESGTRPVQTKLFKNKKNLFITVPVPVRLWQVTVPVPYLDHKKQFHKKISKNY
jgi:hypothetical protein